MNSKDDQTGAFLGATAASNESRQPVRVCIAVVTRERPRMLARLLVSLAGLNLAAERAWLFLVVENGRAAGAETVAGDFANIMRDRVDVAFASEPRIGIPFARNRALDIAYERGCDFLAFIDDDTEARADWISVLVGEIERRELDLVGGPQRLLPPENLSSGQRRHFGALAQRQRRKEQRARDRHAAGTDGAVIVVTNNWLVRLTFVAAHRLRFDEAIGLSGGSDTRFFHDLKAAGGRSGWAPGAIVNETVPASRLTLAYQYRRGRDQALASSQNHHHSRRPAARLRNLADAIWRLMASLGLLAVAPLTGMRSAVWGARSLGASVGRIQAQFGVRSTHYRRVHGD